MPLFFYVHLGGYVFKKNSPTMEIYYTKGGFTVSCKVDWGLLKAEYISGGISYRELAKKHNISRRTVEDKAKNEGWYKQKLAVRGKSVAKTIELLSDVEAEKALRIEKLTDLLLDKIEVAINELDLHIVKNVEKEKIIEYHNNLAANKPTKEIINEREEVISISSIIDKRGLQQIASALKEVKEIKGYKSELDIKEQKARIANLEKQAQKEHSDEAIEVVMDEFQEYSV